MKVAVLYSGGKDSTYAIDYCKSRGWDVRYLLSVKPSRKDCFLFHFATVEHTARIAEILGIRHILLGCDIADPVKEADIIKKEVIKQQKTDPVEAVVLGGTGLQETQLRSVQNALRELGIEVFAAHAGLDHEELFREMVSKGYEILVTQVASEGLMRWLGRKITKDNFDELVADSKKYGFHIGFEGGYADSIVLDGPIFNKKLEVAEMRKVIDDEYCGHVEMEVKAVEKKEVVIGE